MALRFNRTNFDSARVKGTNELNWNTISRTIHNTQLNDINSMRNIIGKANGQTMSYLDFTNSMLIRFNQREFDKNNRDMFSYDFYGREIDWCNSNKGGSANWNCFQMSRDMANTLMSLGYQYIQDMGSDGWGFGAVRRIDSAEIKNDDWQYWNFGMRWGQSYMRFYK